ncbi:NADPH-dependent aldehyde reductase-like protein, chloroplastic [Senna tora]|uniref:NADPH-dependent aldehyde reductase-like protein, chloroplastic n=1 Tax=Senna tora TaxID=362788 RepID=A0A834TII6_9FABA|nr:NADPH-dependent aldehyde reductase-like protein, chloroplastic [Senna tora]
MASASRASGSLQDRVAIVTGSSRGIGREIALHLASLGARVVVNYTSNLAQAELVAAQINSSSDGSPRAIVVGADVSDPSSVKSLFDEAEKAFNSPVHIMVNSAAVIDTKYSSIPDLSLQDFDHIFSVNARGAFLCCKEAAKRLKGGGGLWRQNHNDYVVSGGVIEIWAWGLRSIQGFCGDNGPIATDMFFAGKTDDQVKKAIDESPLCRLGQTADVAPVVGFLATDAGEWVNGQVIRVNGGYV